MGLLATPLASPLLTNLQSFTSLFLSHTEGMAARRKLSLERRKIAPFNFDGSGMEGGEDVKEAKGMVEAYMEMTVEAFGQSAVFGGLGGIEEEVERLVYGKLYPRLMELVEDEEGDKELKDKMDDISWLTFENLDIACLSTGERSSDPTDGGSWESAKSRLAELRYAKSASDKLGIFMSASSLITHSVTGAIEGGGAMGADDFLPAVILCVLHSNVMSIASHVAFANSFLPESALRGEGGYVLTHFYSAVEFLRTAEESGFKVDEGEWGRRVENVRSERRERKAGEEKKGGMGEEDAKRR